MSESEGLVKLLDINSFYPDDEISVEVIDVADVSGLIKKAAHSEITSFVEETLDPKPGKMYLHINALGSGEYFGSNKNGDYFPEDNLKRYYKTFELYGHVFRHHINKDPARSIGKVLYAVYNDAMHRVELISEVDEELGRDIEEGLLAGQFALTSMACKTPFDVCSICGNKAHSREQYCDHLKYSLNKMMPDGRKVMALNVGPLKFFDISIVIRPADITSSVLQKVASHEPVVSSTDMAQAEGLSEPMDKQADTIKQAALNKLSTLIKSVEGDVVMDTSSDVEEILSKIDSPNKNLIKSLRQFPLSETLNAFAEIGSSPSVKFMAELIAQTHAGDDAEGFGEAAEVILYSTDPSEIPVEESFNLLGDIQVSKASPIIVNLILRNSDMSVLPSEVEKRAALYDGYLGYNTKANQLPAFIMKSPQEIEQERQRIQAEMAPVNSGPGMFKTLLALGGAALLARYALSSMMDKKVQEYAMYGLNSQVANPYAKIMHEKQAHEASSFIDRSEQFLFATSKNSGFF